MRTTCRTLTSILLAAAAFAAGCVAEPDGDGLPPRRSNDDGQIGTIRLVNEDGATATVSYLVENGHMMWQEDIDLGPAPPPNLRSLPTAVLGKRWPGGHVDFVIDPSVAAHTTAIRAMAAVYNAKTPLTLHEGKETGHYYLRYTAASGTSNTKVGWQQPTGSDLWLASTVFLDPDMSGVGADQIITHETGHAMGLYHEQSREDRSSFATYDESCVEPGKEGNFDTVQFEPADVGDKVGDYDLTSVMEYGSWQICDNTASSPSSPAPPSWATRKKCICYPLWKKGFAKTDPAGMIIPSTSLSKEDINALWHMYEPTLGGNEDDDQFGSALAAADFDQDGYVDLAVGAKREAPGSDPRSGVVSLYKGTRTGLVAWTWFTSGWIDTPADGDRFGAALATGDLDDDGFPDLVVGAPRRFSDDAGAVYYLRGGPNGLSSTVRISQSDLGATGGTDDNFGTALAIGDFDNDGQDDLAIGAPGKRPSSSAPASGRVFVATWNDAAGDFDSFDAVSPADAPGGSNLAGMEFGTALAAGDFNHDHKSDLVVGAPESNMGSGAVYVFLGGATALTGNQIVRVSTTSVWDRFGAALAVGDFNGTTWGTANTRMDQLAVGAPDRGNPFIQEGWVYTFRPQFVSSSYVGLQAWKDFGQTGAGLNNDPYDHFGSVLAAGNFNDGDPFDDLLVGVPDETYSGNNDSGAVLLLFGGSSGVTGAGTSYWQPSGYDNAAGDNFGGALAVGDFSGNGKLDFVAGAPFERNGSDPSAGGINLYTGRQATWPAFYSFHDQESGAYH